MYNQFHASAKGKGLEQTVIHNPQMQGTVKRFEQTAMHNPQFDQTQSSRDSFEGTEFSANDRSVDSFELSDSLGT